MGVRSVHSHLQQAGPKIPSSLKVVIHWSMYSLVCDYRINSTARSDFDTKPERGYVWISVSHPFYSKKIFFVFCLCQPQLSLVKHSFRSVQTAGSLQGHNPGTANSFDISSPMQSELKNFQLLNKTVVLLHNGGFCNGCITKRILLLQLRFPFTRKPILCRLWQKILHFY